MIKWYYILVLCVVEITIHTQAGSFFKTKRVKMEVKEFETCPGENDLAITLEEPSIYIDPETETLLISGTLILGDPLDNETLSTLTIKKCLNKLGTSCVKHLQYDFRNICTLMWTKNTPANAFAEKIEGLKRQCPIIPGKYNLDDAPIEVNGLIPATSLVEGYWRLQYVGTRHGKMIACYTASATISLKTA